VISVVEQQAVAH